MMKFPAFQFYPSDWRSDPGVQALDYFERGVWFEIICLMHESSERGRLLLNGAPMPDEALARILGLDKQILTNTLTTLLTYGVASRDPKDNALICRRMVRDEELRQIRTQAGKKGGNPVLLKQNPTTRVNLKSTPSSSSSIKEKDTSEEVSKKRRGSRLPSLFPLTAEMERYARERRPDLDPLTEHEKFCNFWWSKTGHDATKLDWPATWRNWILNARASPAARPDPTPPVRLPSPEEAMRVAENYPGIPPPARTERRLE